MLERHRAGDRMAQMLQAGEPVHHIALRPPLAKLGT
jgi:hypothetical protein